MKFLTSVSSLLLLAGLAANSAHADPKAYEYEFDQRMSEVACLEKAIAVAAQYHLVIQPREANGDHGLNGADGERAGVAYYSVKACHIYVF
jgi:hypothetical protein